MFDQLGSGARQSDNKNRVGVWHSEAHALQEEWRCAYRDLFPCVGFADLRMVKAFGALECVAALVKLPGFRVFLQILEGLAEGEAQMVAIDQVRGRSGLGGAVLGQFYGWYDLIVTVAEDPTLEYRRAGPRRNRTGQLHPSAEPGRNCPLQERFSAWDRSPRLARWFPDLPRWRSGPPRSANPGRKFLSRRRPNGCRWRAL